MSTFLAGIQWLFFMFANTLVIPLSLGDAFQLAPDEIAISIQRSFVITGAACVLQALIGHRYPLMDGQAGLWWGFLLSLCASAPSMGHSLPELGGALAIGIILAGIVIVVLGAFGVATLLQRLFTSTVMFVFMLLLSIQLISIFFKGMLGLSEGSTIDIRISGLSLIIVALVTWISLKGRGAVANFAILIGLVVGWVLYTIFFPAKETVSFGSATWLTWFPWGKPHWETGIVITAFLTGLINTSNSVATLKAAESVFDKPTSAGQNKRSFVLNGVYSIVAGLFGLAPFAPYTSSLGFLQSTRILRIAPFLVGSSLFVLLGLSPGLSAFFIAMPMSVGHAVLFVAYLQMFGSALRNIEGTTFNNKTIYRVAIPSLVGIAIMIVPPQALTGLPPLMRPLFGSGLLVGICLSLLMENTFNWQKYEGRGGETDKS